MIRFHGQNSRQQNDGDRHKHKQHTCRCCGIVLSANENSGAMRRNMVVRISIYFMSSVRARALQLENSGSSWPNNLKHM